MVDVAQSYTRGNASDEDDIAALVADEHDANLAPGSPADGASGRIDPLDESDLVTVHAADVAPALLEPAKAKHKAPDAE